MIKSFIEDIEMGNWQSFCMSLLKKEVDPSQDRNIAICTAVNWNRIGMVRTLLEDPRVNPGDRLNECIRRASRRGYYDIAKLLLQHPLVDPSVVDNLPLSYAVDNNDIDMIKLLFTDPRVNTRDYLLYNSPIKIASSENRRAVLRFLLEHSNKQQYKK